MPIQPLTNFELNEHLADLYSEAITFDGLEEAIIGYGHQFYNPVAIYDYQKIMNLLVNQGMTDEEAVEYFNFNIQGAYLGDNTPIILDLPLNKIST